MSLSVSRRRFVCASALGITSLSARSILAANSEVSDRINPLIGASTSEKLGEGKTYPGPSTPFGLIQLGPDTMTGGDNAPGYFELSAAPHVGVQICKVRIHQSGNEDRKRNL